MASPPSALLVPSTSNILPAETFARVLRRGSELLREGDPSQARGHAERALFLRPNDAAARHVLALALFRIGHLERALVVYEALLLDAPDSVPVKVNLAVVLLKLGRASAARPLLESVVAASPGHRRGWGYLGVALEQLGLIAEAEAALLRGQHVNAARGLRERHGERMAHVPSQRFSTSLPPPDLVRIGPPDAWRATEHGEQPEEISFDQTVSPRLAMAPPAIALPLLDAALSALLVVPHQVTVASDPAGFVVVRLLEGTDPREGGFAARAHLVHALAGPVRHGPLVPRSPAGDEPLWSTAACFERISGSGKVVLGRWGRRQLFPVELVRDVAFLREDAVAGFDHALLRGATVLRQESSTALTLVRFRGEGVVLLGLPRPFFALDVAPAETVHVRADSLIGWIGPLTVEAPSGAQANDGVLAARGDGTLLVARQDADTSDSWD